MCKIVVDITLNQPELLTNIVAILGGMHFLMEFAASAHSWLRVPSRRFFQLHLDLLKRCYREKIPAECSSLANAQRRASATSVSTPEQYVEPHKCGYTM